MLMKYAPNWHVFIDRLDQEYPQWGKTMLLPFPDNYRPPSPRRGRQLRRPREARMSQFYVALMTEHAASADLIAWVLAAAGWSRPVPGRRWIDSGAQCL
jgi:hypothetical protein